MTHRRTLRHRRFHWALAAVLGGPAAAFADPPSGYYNSVDATNATTLRATLHAVIDDHTRYPYTAGSTDTWNILELADQDPANSSNILDVYRNRSLAKFGGGTGPYNREHTWPNSYGFPDDGNTNYPYTDCHHLFLSDVGYNSDRANLPYNNLAAGAVERVTDLYGGQGGGSGVFPGNSNWFNGSGWRTWVGRKGDVARAILYMDVRYEGGTHGISGAVEPDLRATDNVGLIVSTGGNASVAYMGLLPVLLEWNTQDPPDAREQSRNDVVFSFQGNRNPFIDHPEWANAIFAPSTSSEVVVAGSLTGITHVFPNPVRSMNPLARVEFALAQPGPVRIDVYSADGRLVRTLVDEMRAAGTARVVWDGTDRHGLRAASGSYFLRLQSRERVDARKVLLLP